MLSKDIRKSFLQYFKNQSHRIVPSASVVPHDDPTLLFNNAGMNQFKDVFLGKSKRDYVKACSSQKCIRVGGKHNDLENVGHTSRHLTFFEMMGNFSFGDYFKKEAIGFAWDVSTHIFNFDPKKIWASVYKDDDESFAYWEKYLPADHIVRFGEEENFWMMGDVGPCGPCSELLYDRGEKYSSASSPYEDVDGERYFEFWNLVFMESNRDKLGNLLPLPKKSVDTGCGLERLASLIEGVDNVFLTDILFSLIKEIEVQAKRKYVENDTYYAPAFHVIADHIRTLAFAIADGAQPSNVDRGYVLRKILRRASRYGKILGFNKPFLKKLVPTLITTMGEDYPELISSKDRIEEILTIEEESFLKTLQRGGNLLSQIIEKSKEKISGDDAFKLKDTYGFPIEEILLIAKDEHLKVDLPRFNELEEKAKETSKKAMKTHQQQFHKNFFEDFSKTHNPCEFIGYDKLEEKATIIAIIVNNNFVDTIEEGQKGIVILDKTPFYAEGGGQVSDTGSLHKGGAEFIVEDCQSPYSGVTTHIGIMKRGQLHKQDHIDAKVNSKRRKSICNNHTATHLLHWALQEVLGPHIKQAGSVVDDKHLRFDFNHHKAVSKHELRKVENLVNEKIRENLEVNDYIFSFSEIQKDPSIKQFFSEKYDEKVRVIDIDFSKELCGGTHVKRLGNIGLFKIDKESSIAAGIRRIEALTGKQAEKHVERLEDLLLSISTKLKTDENKIETRIETLLDDNKQCQLNLKNLKKEKLLDLSKSLISKAKKIKASFSIILEEIDVDFDDLKMISENLSSQIDPSIIVLAAKSDHRCLITIKVSSQLIEKGFFANELIKGIFPIIKGGGGGKKDFSQAGGTDIANINKALTKIQSLIEEKC